MSKRTRGGRTDAESSKKQKMGDGVHPDSEPYHVPPFGERTTFRTFQLIVEGKSIFVCPYFLANFSPFFETLCFGGFREGTERKAGMKEAKYDDVIEMLHVLGADGRSIVRNINKKHFSKMNKRVGERTGEESAKKQRMRDGVLSFDAASVVSKRTFDEPTKLRNYKFIVEGKTIYVCPYFLANFSPFFDALCLGTFSEGQKGEAELKDAKYDDVIEMLKVLGADTENISGEINVGNCVPMLTMADKWQITMLHRKCVAFLETKLRKVPTNLTTTLRLLSSCEVYNVGDKALRNVCSRIAAFGRKVLIEQGVYDFVRDRNVCAAIFAAAPIRLYGKTTVEENSLKHSVELCCDDEEDEKEHEESVKCCSVSECRRPVGYQCVGCFAYLCWGHKEELCTANTAVFATERCENIDKEFFIPQNKKSLWSRETL